MVNKRKTAQKRGVVEVYKLQVIPGIIITNLIHYNGLRLNSDVDEERNQ